LFQIEKRIISLCLSSKTNYYKVFQIIKANDFNNELFKQVFEFLENAYENYENINSDLIIEQFDFEKSKVIMSIISNPFYYEDFDKTLL